MTLSKHATSLLLLIIALFLNGTILYGKETKPDTTKIASLIDKAKKIGEENPDSSAFYFKKVIEQCQALLRTTTSQKDVIQILKKKNIEAELGLGLNYYHKMENDTAIVHFEKAFLLSQDLGDIYNMGESLFDIAEAYLEQSKYTLAMTNYYGALQKFAEIGNQSETYWCYIGMGIVQKQCGNYADAVVCYEKARQIAEDTGMKLQAAYALNNLGVVSYRQGHFSEAMKIYEKALTCFTEMQDEPSASDCMNNIANIYLDKGEPGRALDYLQRSIQFEKVKKDDYRMIARFSNISDAYLALNDLDNALLYIEKGIAQAEKSDDKLMQASCYSVAGNIQLKKGLTGQGLSYLKKSVEMFHSIGSKVEEAESLVSLADAEQSAGKLNDAFLHISQALELADSVKVLKTHYVVYTSLAGLWEKKGNVEKSLSFLKQASALKDSIFSVEKNRAVEEIEAGFTRVKLENENQLLQQKAKLQQQSLRIRNVALCFFALCMVFMLSIGWLVHKRNLDTKAIALQQEALKQNEIDRLNESLLFKERELACKTIFITQKNNLLHKLINDIDLLKEGTQNTTLRLNQLQNELKAEFSPNAWKEFEIQFNEVHPKFQSLLIERFPELSHMERRLCSFLKLDMNTREIAALTGQSFKSIEVARTRIRKKMNLSREDNLANFIASL